MITPEVKDSPPPSRLCSITPSAPPSRTQPSVRPHPSLSGCVFRNLALIALSKPWITDSTPPFCECIFLSPVNVCILQQHSCLPSPVSLSPDAVFLCHCRLRLVSRVRELCGLSCHTDCITWSGSWLSDTVYLKQIGLNNVYLGAHQHSLMHTWSPSDELQHTLLNMYSPSTLARFTPHTPLLPLNSYSTL